MANHQVSLPPPIDARPRRSSRRILRRIGFLALILFALLGLSFAALLVWAVRTGPELERAQDEALAFAASATDEACLAEALSKLSSGWLSWLATSEATFLSTCLDNSTQTPAFCAGVPMQAEETAYVTWLNESCASFQGDEMGCQQLMGFVQVHCEERSPKGAG